MPVWIVLVLGGTVLAVLGLAGLGSILLWVGAYIVLSGIVMTIVSLRRTRRQRP